MWKERILIALSGAVGGILAILADLIQKDEASSVLRIAYGMQLLTKFAIPSYFAAITVLFLGVALCFIFEAKSPRKACYIGASILSIIMTAVPYKSPPPIGSSPNVEFNGSLGADAQWSDFITPKSSYALTPTASGPLTKVHIHLKTSDNKKIREALINLREAKGRRIIGSDKIMQNDLEFMIGPGLYILGVQASGYKIEERTLKINGSEEINVNINLEPSKLPLPFQKFFK
jgi:hypothetical protein